MSSYSNIADGPSRGDISDMKNLGFKDVSEQAETCLRSLCISVKNKMGKKPEMQNPKG